MRSSFWIAGMVAVGLASFALGAETRKPFAATYDAIADTILGSKQAEKGIVGSILDAHYHAAERAFAAGDHEGAAAEMALFGNEGDNRIGGIRKRLLEGGHHHNAEGEAKDIYETAGDDAARQAAWDAFAKAAEPLLK